MPLTRLARSRLVASRQEDVAALLSRQFESVFADLQAFVAGDPEKAALSTGGDAGLLPEMRAHWRELFSRPPDDELVLRARRLGEAQARALSPKSLVEIYAHADQGSRSGGAGAESREAARVAGLMDVIFADMAESFDAFVSGCETVTREREAAALLRAVDAEMDASNAAAETQSGAMRSIVADLEKVIGELRNGVTLVTDGAATATQSIGAVAAAVSELHASSQEVGRQANDANHLVHDAVTRADGGGTAFFGPRVLRGAGDGNRHPDLRHIKSNQPARAQRHHRGGARRRERARLRRRRQ